MNKLKLIVALTAGLFAFTLKKKFSNNLIENSTTSEKDQNEVMDTNKFKDVTYRGLDLNGNRYEIFAGEADFKIENPELINMKIMSAKFYFKDDTILSVWSDAGIYNNKTLDMKFDSKVKANYENSKMYASNAEYSNSKGFLTISDNVKIDNHVHIAHNVTVGKNTAIAACVGIAGSTTIGCNCTIGGGSGINGHINIVDNVHIHGMTMVTKSINKPGMYASGTTVEPVSSCIKIQVSFK